MPRLSTPVKLTLRVDSDLIERTKAYAASNGTSLSKLVAGYFTRLVVDQVVRSEGELTSRLRSRRPIEQPSDEDIWNDLIRKHGGVR